jgi:hypothetical protein
VPPPDRLEELKRQRALLEAQIAKLDQEAAQAPVAPAAELKSGGPKAADPDQALRDFADAPQNPAEVRRGCITIFAWGMALAAAALGTLYYAFYR